MKTLVALLALSVGLAACAAAGQPARQSHTSATPRAGAPGPTATPAQTLFAVLESPAMGAPADAVAIVGLDGYARVKVAFQPRKGPYVPMAATMPQSEAQVGSGGVYYIDGHGVLRLLKVSGPPTVVARFPMTPDQHETWYAVSPDGSRVLAGILTLPAVVAPPAGTDRPATLSGGWTFELDSARAGGATSVLQRQASSDLPGSSPATWPIFPTGWTKDGPVAMVGAPIATQNVWPGGPLYVINSVGQPGTRIGGGDCMAARILASGLVPCVIGPNDTVSVRDSSGQVVWQPSVQGFNALQLSLAPDGSAVTDGHYVATRTQSFVAPNGFQAEGWLDVQTLVGQLDSGELAWIRVDSPTVVHDFGFKGSFVGAL